MSVIKNISTYSNREILIFLLLTVLLVFIIRFIIKSDKAQNLRYNIMGASTTDGTNTKQLSEERKSKLQVKAEKLREKIYSAFWTATNILEDINRLNDAEFIFLYEYYISEFGENPYCAVDWEFLPETDQDEKFMSRAKKLNLPIKNAGIFESC